MTRREVGWFVLLFVGSGCLLAVLGWVCTGLGL